VVLKLNLCLTASSSSVTDSDRDDNFFRNTSNELTVDSLIIILTCFTSEKICEHFDHLSSLKVNIISKCRGIYQSNKCKDEFHSYGPLSELFSMEPQDHSSLHWVQCELLNDAMFLFLPLLWSHCGKSGSETEFPFLYL
jgi:hypothetical protein